MKYKNRYLYYSILPCLLFLIAIGVYVSGYNPPTQGPPFGNLPAPINAGEENQIKKGGLTIQGNLIAEGNLTTGGILKLGQFATAPDGAQGALYFNTTKDVVQIYVSGAWRDLIAAKLGLGETCSLDGDCDLGHCVDEYCCNAPCSGICEACNLAGSIGTCTDHLNGTDPEGDCTGNCDTCSSGNCVAKPILCTGDAVQCTGSGTEYNCSGDPGLCTGNCVQVIGSGTSYSCEANNAICTGDCSFCNGSGTEYNCAGSNGFCLNDINSCNCSGSGTVWNCQACSNPYPSNCGYATCSNYTCGGQGVLAYKSGTLNGETVYCDEHNRLWTPTRSGTYTWANALTQCSDLSYAGFTDWVLPSCTSKVADSSCYLRQYGIDACGGYPCTPSWDSAAPANYYWSSTEYSSSYAYRVDFYDGYVLSTSKTRDYYVRCVRGQ